MIKMLTNFMLRSTVLMITVVLSVCFYFPCIAQNLPNAQQRSLWAPATIKIDGKPTEWNNQFQAYNHATDILYTISNDNDNLYLIIQASKPRIIDKIIDVGVTFIINTAGKKKR